MPTFEEVREAAVDLAAYLGADCTPEGLIAFTKDAAQNPYAWGHPRSWSRRPNWTANDIRREVAAILWGLPTHPDRIPAAYRGLPFRALSTIADGGIRQLWGDAPSSRVLHEWLCAVAVARRYCAEQWRIWLAYPWAWFARHCPTGGYIPRTSLIAKWLVAKKGWKGWRTGIPVGYGPDGQMQHVRPVDMLDEVWDTDLPSGEKTNPERVFRTLLARKGEEELQRIAEANAPLPPMPWTEIHGVRQLRTSRELVEEGTRMAHCVGGYASACRAGRCYILHLPDSTAEIRPDGTVYQHRAKENSEPSASDKALLEKWLRTRKEVKK